MSWALPPRISLRFFVNLMKIKFQINSLFRKILSLLPRKQRASFYRSFVKCDAKPNKQLVLKIAETKEELEECFRILHDAYVSSGFMKPDPSGMRISIYTALPTTTTLCAKFNGKVVGTISLIRESLIGFPMQSIFNLNEVRSLHGNIAEVSALAIHPKFRNTGGSILFPLMKFMYEYSISYFDTRHLVIAVNPRHIDMYESLLCFTRLSQNQVDSYDFVNGAPAIGATLDLKLAPEVIKKHYKNAPPGRNLYDYFVNTRIDNINMPTRHYFTTNDPVMTPELLDYFFNQRTNVFAEIDERKKQLLHNIYDLNEFKSVLPAITSKEVPAQRTHQRYSIKCPGTFEIQMHNGIRQIFSFVVNELSLYGFSASSPEPLPVNVQGDAIVMLGQSRKSIIKATVVRDHPNGFFAFKLLELDNSWANFLEIMQSSATHKDLDFRFEIAHNTN